jgi:Flp pilus assembly protein TadB
VSKERAQRRAVREQQAAAHRAARERRSEREARRRTTRAAWRARLPRRTRWRGQQGLLARRRRAENAVILLLFLAVQAIVWLVTDDPWVWASAAVLGVLSLPVLVTLALDRRTRP